jgi:hypothetical protein
MQYLLSAANSYPLTVRALLGQVLYPRQPLGSLRPPQRRRCQQCDMLEFSSRQAFGQTSTSVRMNSAIGVGSERQCEMDKPLGSSIKWPRLAEGGSKLLKRGPDIGVFLRDAFRDRRQGDRRILGEISRQCLFHRRLPLRGRLHMNSAAYLVAGLPISTFG